MTIEEDDLATLPVIIIIQNDGYRDSDNDHYIYGDSFLVSEITGRLYDIQYKCKYQQSLLVPPNRCLHVSLVSITTPWNKKKKKRFERKRYPTGCHCFLK